MHGERDEPLNETLRAAEDESKTATGRGDRRAGLQVDRGSACR
jgi:hypothetical protein